MPSWIVVVPFTPDVLDVGDLALFVLLVVVAGAVAWTIVRRRRRCLALLRCLVDLASHVEIDLRDHVVTDAELLQSRAVDNQRIALFPFFKLPFGPIFRGVGA